MRLEASEVVERPPDEVFDYVADPRNEETWGTAPGGRPVEVELVSGEPGEVEAVYELRRRGRFLAEKRKLELVSMDRPHRVEFRMGRKAGAMRIFACEPTEGGTVLTMIQEADTSGATGRLAERYAESRPEQVRAMVEIPLARIKEALESDPPA